MIHQDTTNAISHTGDLIRGLQAEISQESCEGNTTAGLDELLGMAEGAAALLRRVQSGLDKLHDGTS